MSFGKAGQPTFDDLYSISLDALLALECRPARSEIANLSSAIPFDPSLAPGQFFHSEYHCPPRFYM